MAFLRESIVPRAYQLAIASSALHGGNTLVVLPTGLGKTLIAFLVMQEKIKEGKVFFLAPTKPLVQQHYKTFLASCNFEPSEAALITGEVSPKKRKEMWEKRACFSTPQTLKNDIKAGRASAQCSLCVIDEAHRAVGNYAYTYVAAECMKAGGLILGLTASPGGSKKRIEEIVAALGIENIEIRTPEDADVRPYVQRLDIEYVRVPLGESFSKVRELLQGMLKEHTEHLANFGFVAPTRSKKGLVELREKIMKASDRVKYAALSFYTTVFNLTHMLELIETQGLSTFLAYVEKMKARPDTKARRRIFNDKRFIEALRLCASASEHPKLAELLRILRQKISKGEKVLVFAQYRDQVKTIVETLKREGFSAERFVGKKEGVTAEEQKKTIERFSRGEFDIMVATSIGEEGLDIPSVDTVIFFEPIPSEIRSIQRRGRAGRLRAGRVVVLIAADTKDEAHFYSSRKKEERMRHVVGKLKRKFASQPKGSQPQMALPEKKARQKGGAVQKKITDF
ncbi:MAG: helicase-related protein [Candidatus Micrarchaeota archaeon]|nr:helicase-related protein [Candidatus Micrarchaeota archaeon]